MAVGKRSGKRTLAGIMDDEIAAKRKKQEDAAAAAGAGTGAATPRMPTASKFFHAAQRSVSDPRGDRLALGWGGPVAPVSRLSTPDHARRGHGHSQQEPVAGSSGLSQREKEKENVHPEADEVVDADMDAGADRDQDHGGEMAMGAPDAIAQEDGYASPTESMGQWDSPDISSPVRPGAGKRGGGGGGDWDEEEEYDADVLSSSPVARTRTRKRPAVVVERVVTRALPLRPVLNTSFSQRKRARSRSRSRSGSRTRRRKPFGGSGEELGGGVGAGEGSCGEGSAAGRDGPDLRKAIFDDEFDDIHDWDEITSGGEDCEHGLDGDTQAFADEDEDVMFSTASSTPGAIAPATDGDDIECEGEASAVSLDEDSSEELEDHSHSGTTSLAARNAKVADGWWERWARSGTSARGQGANTNSSSNVAASAGSDQVCLSLPSILLALPLGH